MSTFHWHSRTFLVFRATTLGSVTKYTQHKPGFLTWGGACNPWETFFIKFRFFRFFGQDHQLHSYSAPISHRTIVVKIGTIILNLTQDPQNIKNQQVQQFSTFTPPSIVKSIKKPVQHLLPQWEQFTQGSHISIERSKAFLNVSVLFLLFLNWDMQARTIPFFNERKPHCRTCNDSLASPTLSQPAVCRWKKHFIIKANKTSAVYSGERYAHWNHQRNSPECTTACPLH